MARMTPATPKSPRGNRVRGVVFALVGRWWVGPVALVLLVAIMVQRVGSRPSAWGGLLHVVVPTSTNDEPPQVVRLDGSWDDMAPYLTGKLGSVWSVNWNVDVRHTSWFVPWLCTRTAEWRVARVVNVDGPGWKGTGNKETTTDLEAIGTSAKMLLIQDFSSSPHDHVRLVARAMQSNRPTEIRVLWGGVAWNAVGVISSAALCGWIVWMPRAAISHRIRNRIRRGLCPRCKYPIDAGSTATGSWMCPECGARGAGVGDAAAAATPPAAGPSS